MALVAMTLVGIAVAGGAAGRDPFRPALELRARTLSRELRCMVCQNQSIDDSDAPLARDLRLLVRERLRRATATRRCSISSARAMASSCC